MEEKNRSGSDIIRQIDDLLFVSGEDEPDFQTDLAEATVKRALKLARQTDNPEIQARTLINLARIARRKADLKEQEKYLSEARRLIGDSENVKLLLPYYQQLGFLRESNGDLEAALSAFKRVMELSEQSGNANARFQVLPAMGHISARLGDLKGALDCYLQRLEIDTAKDDKFSRANILANIGILSYELEDLQQAVVYTEKAYRAYREMNNLPGMARSLNSLGIFYRIQGKLEKALGSLKKSLEITRKMHDMAGIGITSGNIGELLLEKNSYAQALEYLEDALEIKREYGRREKLPPTLSNLSKACQALGKLEEASTYLSEAVAIAEETGQVETRRQLYRDYSTLLSNKKDYQEAFEFLERYNALEAETFQERLDELKEKIEAGYRVEKEEREALIHRLKNVELERANRLITEQNQEIVELREQLDSLQDEVKKRDQSIQAANRFGIIAQKQGLPGRERYRSHVQDMFLVSWGLKDTSFDSVWSCVREDLYIALLDTGKQPLNTVVLQMTTGNLLSKEILERGNHDPRTILLNTEAAIATLAQSAGETGRSDTLDGAPTLLENPGIRIALIRIDPRNKRLSFAGAGIDLYRNRSGRLERTGGGQMGLGVNPDEDGHVMEAGFSIQSGDLFYLFSDGILGQMVKRDGKEGLLSRKEIESLLVETVSTDLNEQRKRLEKRLGEYLERMERLDDITFIGMEI